MTPDDLGHLAKVAALARVFGPQVAPQSARNADHQDGDKSDQPKPQTMLSKALSDLLYHYPPPRPANS
jgi:hypothetical protein